MRARRVLALSALVGLAAAGGVVAVQVGEDGRPAAASAAGAAETAGRTWTRPDRMPATTATTEATPPTTAPPTSPPTTVAPTTTTAPLDPRQEMLAPYRGLGTWVDAYDYTMQWTGGAPVFGVADVDRLAALGVQTIFIQAARYDSPTDVVEPDLLLPIIERAHQWGVRVVAWYLPTHEDPSADLRRLLAMATLDVDGIAVNIESTRHPDAAERSRRAIDLSAALRAALPHQVLAAVPLPPVVLEVLNGNYWPGFPWAELAPYYDVWLPMTYWTNRSTSSPYRDAYLYTAENIDRMRANLGNPDAACHALGGIGDRTTPADIAGMVRAANERGCMGGSVYDYRTTSDEVWAAVQALRTAD